MAGMPPVGLGVYDRSDNVDGEPFTWRAINATRHDVGLQVQTARAMGGEVWLWAGPGQWTPGMWRASLARFVTLCRELGCSGVITDPENEWPNAPVSEAQAFGEGLRAAARDVRIGLTSYPEMRHVRTMAVAAGQAVWGSPQIYGRSVVNRERFAEWWDHWTAAFGPGRVIPSIAGWNASPRISNAAGYDEYLSMIPRAPGAIVWPNGDNIPAHQREALARYNPGGSLPGTALRAILSFVARPQAAALVAIVLIAALLAVRFMR